MGIVPLVRLNPIHQTVFYCLFTDLSQRFCGQLGTCKGLQFHFFWFWMAGMTTEALALHSGVVPSLLGISNGSHNFTFSATLQPSIFTRDMVRIACQFLNIGFPSSIHHLERIRFERKRNSSRTYVTIEVPGVVRCCDVLGAFHNDNQDFFKGSKVINTIKISKPFS